MIIFPQPQHLKWTLYSVHLQYNEVFIKQKTGSNEQQDIWIYITLNKLLIIIWIGQDSYPQPLCQGASTVTTRLLSPCNGPGIQVNHRCLEYI